MMFLGAMLMFFSGFMTICLVDADEPKQAIFSFFFFLVGLFLVLLDKFAG